MASGRSNRPREGIHALKRLGGALLSDSGAEGVIPADLEPYVYLQTGAPALRSAFVEAEARTLTLQSWFVPFLAVLRDTPVYLFKGLGVANSLYPALSARPLGDVDILAACVEDVKQMVAPLAVLGFQPVYGSHAFDRPVLEAMYQVPFWHPRHGLLEVHHRLYRDVPTPFVDRARCAAHRAVIFDRDVLQVSPAYMALILSVHLAQSTGELRPVWLLDLALLFQQFDDSDWLTFSIEAEAAGLSYFAAAASMLVRELWEKWVYVSVPRVRGVWKRVIPFVVGTYLESGWYRGDVLRAAHRLDAPGRSLVADYVRHYRQRRLLASLSRAEGTE